MSSPDKNPGRLVLVNPIEPPPYKGTLRRASDRGVTQTDEEQFRGAVERTWKELRIRMMRAILKMAQERGEPHMQTCAFLMTDVLHQMGGRRTSSCRTAQYVTSQRVIRETAFRLGDAGIRLKMPHSAVIAPGEMEAAASRLAGEKVPEPPDDRAGLPQVVRETVLILLERYKTIVTGTPLTGWGPDIRASVEAAIQKAREEDIHWFRPIPGFDETFDGKPPFWIGHIVQEIRLAGSCLT